MNWGTGIIVSFVLFAIFIGVLSFVCMREDISLVSKDYYKEELVYQQQIERMNNANLLKERPIINIADGKLEIQFDQLSEMEFGEVRLFRPSDSGLDKRFVLLKSLEKTQVFDVGSLPRGMYRAKMKWTMNGKEYYIEDVINL